MISVKYIKFHPNGRKEYLLGAAKDMESSFGVIHFREDGPAEILEDGTEIYYINGVKSRLDAPAVISPNGYQEYWCNGELGRKDGPAIIYPDGGKDWIYNKLYHRKNGPAREFADGTKHYFYEGKRIDASGDYDYVRKVRLIKFADI
jgi:hypothetical protein